MMKMAVDNSNNTGYHIKTLSKWETIALYSKTNITAEKSLIISINNVKDSDVTENILVDNANFKILKLYFDDIWLYDGKGYNEVSTASSCKFMSLSDGFQIKNFIDNNRDIKNIIVHCTMGISRSGAIAYCLAKYLNSSRLSIYLNRTTGGNSWCYMIMCKILNLKESSEEFEYLKEVSYQICHARLEQDGIDINIIRE